MDVKNVGSLRCETRKMSMLSLPNWSPCSWLIEAPPPSSIPSGILKFEDPAPAPEILVVPLAVGSLPQGRGRGSRGKIRVRRWVCGGEGGGSGGWNPHSSSQQLQD